MRKVLGTGIGLGYGHVGVAVVLDPTFKSRSMIGRGTAFLDLTHFSTDSDDVRESAIALDQGELEKLIALLTQARRILNMQEQTALATRSRRPRKRELGPPPDSLLLSGFDQWFNRFCTVGPGYTETNAALFSSWAHWAVANRKPIGTTMMFAQVIGLRGFTKLKHVPGAHDSRGFAGLRLRTQYELRLPDKSA